MFAPWGMQSLPGLLTPDDKSYLQNQGLLGLGASLLAASGPSTTRTSLGQALGQGMLAQQQAQQQAMQGLLQNKLYKQKFDEAEREKQREAKLSGLLGNQSQTYAPGAGVGMLENRQGSGLLGDLESGDPNAYNKFYAGVAGLGGDYTKTGIAGLNALNSQQGRGEYSVPVYGNDGTIYAFDTRNKTLTIPSVNGVTGAPVVGAQYNPSLKGNIRRAEKAGEITGETEAISTVKKPQQAKDMLSLLSDADALIDKSTGSLFGTGLDMLAGSAGYATEGATAASKLKVLQAGLMTNMPRMEGPQSDRDVQLYKEAAGQIGDPTVPNDIKKAAVATIREINQRYASRGKGNATQDSKNQTRRVRVDAQGNELP